MYFVDMKFLITVKRENDLGKIDHIIKDINYKIRSTLKNKQNGEMVSEWEHVIYFKSFEFHKVKFSKEIKRYTKEESKITTRSWIDNEQIASLNTAEVYMLICESVLRSMFFLSSIKKFKYQEIHDELVSLFREEGWIYTRFFMTGEIDSSVFEKINSGMNSIEERIRLSLSTRDYGKGITYWGQIVICMPNEVYESGYFKEIKKYTVKFGEVELRLKIDYKVMLKADKQEAAKLICKSILRGVDIAENELEIEDFDFMAFRKDIRELFSKEGWL